MTVAPLATLTPAVVCGFLFVLVRASGHDFALADQLYAWQGGAWAWRHDFLLSKILHARAQKLAVAVHGFVVLSALVSLAWSGGRRWRRALTYLALSAVSGIVLVAMLKSTLPFPCPSKLLRYGGLLPDAFWLGGEPPGTVQGCFPAAHATAGFALFGWYFLARRAGHRRCWRYALPGLVTGSVFGATQQLRGAHFLSHDLAAAALCWALAWLAAHVMFDVRGSDATLSRS